MTKQSAGKLKNKPDRTAIKTHRKHNAKRPRTKRDLLIRMLNARNGAGADVICRKLGWQPHTTRAAVSGLRKAGFDIQSETSGKGKPRRYRIVSEPQTDGVSNAA